MNWTVINFLYVQNKLTVVHINRNKNFNVSICYSLPNNMIIILSVMAMHLLNYKSQLMLLYIYNITYLNRICEANSENSAD